MARFVAEIPAWSWNLIIVAAAVVAALAIQWVALKVAERGASKTSTRVDDNLVRRLRGPLRWVLIVFLLSTLEPWLMMGPAATTAWSRASGLVLPALVGWIAIALLGAAIDMVRARADISVVDNLQARRRRTRASILYRVGVFLILLATVCMMLMSIPSVRDIGVTLIASAGLAALAVGAAAQPALKNLIAGIQMAFTEPITNRRRRHHRRRMGPDRGDPAHLCRRQAVGRTAAGRAGFEIPRRKLPELDQADEPAGGERQMASRSRR